MSFGVVPNAMNGRQYSLGGKFSRTLRMIKVLMILLSLFTYEMKAADFFIKKNFVILGQNPRPSSNPISILSCGSKVKVMHQKNKTLTQPKRRPQKIANKRKRQQKKLLSFTSGNFVVVVYEITYMVCKRCAVVVFQ